MTTIFNYKSNINHNIIWFVNIYVIVITYLFRETDFIIINPLLKGYISNIDIIYIINIKK